MYLWRYIPVRSLRSQVWQVRNIRTINDDLAGIDGPYAGDSIQRGGLTRAVTTNDRHEIPGIQI